MMPAARLCRTVSATLLLACGASLGGCLISSNSHESYSGKFVSEPTFNRIEPGVTTRQWIMGTLGEPTQKGERCARDADVNHPLVRNPIVGVQYTIEVNSCRWRDRQQSHL